MEYNDLSMNKIIINIIGLILLGLSTNVMSDSKIEIPYKLESCPASPNCVSTLATDEEHSIEPMKYQGDYLQAKEKLIRVLNTLPRISVIKNEETYLHVTQTSFVFRFVDDVEFVFDDELKTIQFTSRSRTGHSDFGVNRKRMENIRTLYEK